MMNIYGYCRVSTREQNLERQIIAMRQQKVEIRVLDMPLLDTGRQIEGLTGQFISNLVLQILAYVAEQERSFIRQRQAEGILVAKENGIKFGCPKKEDPEGFEMVYQLWKKRKITVRSAAKQLGMSTTTFHRRCKEKMKVELEKNW